MLVNLASTSDISIVSAREMRVQGANESSNRMRKASPGSSNNPCSPDATSAAVSTSLSALETGVLVAYFSPLVSDHRPIVLRVRV